MATLRFTHGYDVLFSIGTIVGGVTLVAAGAELLAPISNLIEEKLNLSNSDWAKIILILAYWMFGYVAAIALLRKTILPDWLPTYLHVRFSIFTKISSEEATKVSFLFDGSLGGVWYPLNTIGKIDAEFRREALFRFANKISIERGWRKPFEMPEDSFVSQQQQSQHHDSHKSKENAAKQRERLNQQTLVCLKILGLYEIPKSFDVIKLAYRRKIREFHPDKFAGERAEVLQYAEEISKRLNVAYAFLENRHSAGVA